MSSQTMLPGVALCSPFEQGDLDNLCGLYAAVNALCVTAAPIRPLKPSEAQHVLNAGVAYLQRRGWLADAVIHGMSLPRQWAVTQHMASAAEGIVDLKFVVIPFAQDDAKLDTSAAMKVLAERIGAGSAVILCLENTFWHYTMVSGLSAKRVYLFDSDGLHWIERRSFRIGNRAREARHCVSLSSMIEVKLAAT